MRLKLLPFLFILSRWAAQGVDDGPSEQAVEKGNWVRYDRRYQWLPEDGGDMQMRFTDRDTTRTSFARKRKIATHAPPTSKKTTTESSFFDFWTANSKEDTEDDSEEDTEDDGDEDNEDNYKDSEERQPELRIRRKYIRTHKLIFPLLLAYKLKFFTLVPLFVGALILLKATTGIAGFFFALFSAALGLRGKHPL